MAEPPQAKLARPRSQKQDNIFVYNINIAIAHVPFCYANLGVRTAVRTAVRAAVRSYQPDRKQ